MMSHRADNPMLTGDQFDLFSDSIRDDRQQFGGVLLFANVLGRTLSTGWRLSLIGFDMHHYQHHIGDYRRDTMHLSIIEHGAYRQLLDMYYLSESPIPKETEVVFRRLCAKTEDEQKAIQTVLNEFFEYNEKIGWRHKRCDNEIQRYADKAEKAKENGKLGGRPKKTEVVISGFSEKTEAKANQEPLTTNQEPINFMSGKPDVSPPLKANGKKAEAVEVLNFLNTKTGRAYQPVEANLNLILNRLKEGATVADCRAVIAKKAREWGTDDKMAEYLRPATLFNATKFAQYRGELVENPND